SPRDFRGLGKNEPAGDRRSQSARNHLHGAAGADYDFLRRLSQAHSRCHARVRRPSGRVAPARRRSGGSGGEPVNLAAETALIAPELVLAMGGMALLMLGVFLGDRVQSLFSCLAIVLLLVVGTMVLFGSSAGPAFHGAVVVDEFSRFVKVLVLGGAALVLLMGESFLIRSKLGHFEFPVLVVFSVLGMMLMASAADFITLYLGLELQSLALYVLAAFDRDNLRSTEAGLKYFVLGALSSGMMLYGISLIYGFAGTTSFTGIAEAAKQSTSIGLIFGLVFLFTGLAFKVSAVPFHMWTPDVYEGAP